MGWVRSCVSSFGKCPSHFCFSLLSPQAQSLSSLPGSVYRFLNRANLHPGFHLRLVFDMPSAFRCSTAETSEGVPGVVPCLGLVPRWPDLYNREPSPLHPPVFCSSSLQCSHMSKIRPLLLALQLHTTVSQAQPGCRILQNGLQ